MTMSTCGKDLRVLIGRELMRPTDLTIDFNMGGRLFWADEVKNVIESCNPDGQDRTIMFTAQSGRPTLCAIIPPITNTSIVVVIWYYYLPTRGMHKY